MKKLILVLFLALFAFNINAQDQIRLAVYQDARLAVAEDKTGNYQPFTLDLLVKFKMQGYQKNGVYLTISPMFEYADIDGIYKRYAVDMGLTFNEALRWGLEITPSINYGMLDRWGLSWLVFGADLEASVEIFDDFRISILGQLVHRKDLEYAYGDTHVVASGFIGVQYRIF